MIHTYKQQKKDKTFDDRTEKEPLSGCVTDDILWRCVQHFHDASQLLDLVLAGEYRIAGIQFRQDAT